MRLRGDRHLAPQKRRAPVVVLDADRGDVAAREVLLGGDRDRVHVAAQRRRADDDAAALEGAEALELGDGEIGALGDGRRPT